MKQNSRIPVLAANQKRGARAARAWGIRKIAARIQNTAAMTGRVLRSRGRAGCVPWYKARAPARKKSPAGARWEPNSAGQAGCHPPRNRMVASAHPVIMLAYSAMKKAANFMLLYSVWKPATSSFSASGRSKGTRLVSAKAQIKKIAKLTICGNGRRKRFHFGRNPK